MSNIRTTTEEIAELNYNLKESFISGEYEETVSIIQKLIDKVDELVAEVNKLKSE